MMIFNDGILPLYSIQTLTHILTLILKSVNLLTMYLILSTVWKKVSRLCFGQYLGCLKSLPLFSNMITNS